MNDMRELRRLVDDVAKTPVPPVDWDRVEARIFERIEHEKPPVAIALRSRAWRPVVAIAAVAATIAAVVSFTSIGRSPAPSRSAIAVVHPRAGSALQVEGQLAGGVIDAVNLHTGDEIVADTGPITVNHQGHASWTMSEASRVSVEQLAPVVMLDLRAGSVRVEVVPSSMPESFVVRVDDTVVAVHGTIFTVERKADRALVHVERGSVAVGARSRKAHSLDWIMTAPSTASFSLDGARTSTFLERDEPAHSPVAVAPESPPATAAQSTVAAEPSKIAAVAPPSAPHNPSSPLAAPATTAASEGPSELPEVLTPELARSSLDSIAAQVTDCHRRLSKSPAETGLKVTVQTTVFLTIAPDGHMTMGRFDPPLSPDVQACASNVLLATHFARARNTSNLQLPLRF